MEQQAMRFNDGKVRYDLLEPYAIQQLAEVFTAGAQKYEDNNWRKGLKWSNITSSLKRHLAAYERGEDFDKETGLLHAAHIAWNAMALITHYKDHPSLDDRYKAPQLRIAVDIDDVICDWVTEWCALHDIPIPNSWNFQNNMTNLFQSMNKDGSLEDFYLNLKPRVKASELPFEPVCYISHRPVSKHITEAWLQKNGFPTTPVVHVENRKDKLAVCKEYNVDYFIDDNYDTYTELNKHGVCCFLMDALHNKKYDVGYRRIKNFNDFKQRFL